MKRILLAACAVFCISSAAMAQDAYIGQIENFGTNFCPTNYLPANGKLLKIIDYQALYLLLGTRYGGDGVNTFALPNMRQLTTAKPTLAPVTECIAVFGIFPTRN